MTTMHTVMAALSVDQIVYYLFDFLLLTTIVLIVGHFVHGSLWRIALVSSMVVCLVAVVTDVITRVIGFHKIDLVNQGFVLIAIAAVLVGSLVTHFLRKRWK